MDDSEAKEKAASQAAFFDATRLGPAYGFAETSLHARRDCCVAAADFVRPAFP
jgi:hypothetical protein